jgi:hypothetical protein
VKSCYGQYLIAFICRIKLNRELLRNLFSAIFVPHCCNVQEKEGRGRGVRIRRTKRWAKYTVNPRESGIRGEVIQISEVKDNP